MQKQNNLDFFFSSLKIIFNIKNYFYFLFKLYLQFIGMLEIAFDAILQLSINLNCKKIDTF